MRHHLRSVLGILLSVLLLWWALRGISFQEVAHELREVDVGLFLAAQAVILLTFVTRAIRWGVFLRPAAPELPFRPRFAGVMIGFAANNLLPARVGEFARALALSRLSPVSATAAFAALVLERMLDAVVLLGLLFAAMAAAPFASGEGVVAGVDLQSAASYAGVLLTVVGAALVALVVAPDASIRVAEAASARLLPKRLRRPIVDMLESFLRGLAALRSGRLLALSIGWALAQWLICATGYWLAFLAFGIDAPFAAAVFLQSLISFAVSIPSSPGFFGPFEAAAKFGLGLWGVAQEKAISYAIGVHIGGFIPVTLIGLWYVWRLGLRWSDVKHSEEVVEDEAEHDAAISPAPAEDETP